VEAAVDFLAMEARVYLPISGVEAVGEVFLEMGVMEAWEVLVEAEAEAELAEMVKEETALIQMEEMEVEIQRG
jgi:hypothetical protein